MVETRGKHSFAVEGGDDFLPLYSAQASAEIVASKLAYEILAEFGVAANVFAVACGLLDSRGMHGIMKTLGLPCRASVC
jgi:hypothetical protein